MTWRPTRSSVGSWALYDLANTVFALGVGSLYFASWLTDEVGRLPSLLRGNGDADLALAVVVDAAMLVVIVLGPWIGARSDHHGPRSRYLAPATLLAVAPTFFLATVSPAWSLALYGVALVGFNLGSVVYDAMLPDVSTPQNIGRVSGIGIGVGYLGSVVAWAIGELLLDAHGYPVVFRAIAVAFTVFALPSFFFVKERPRAASPGPAPRLAGSLRGLVAAWRRTRQYPGVTRFLVGRFFYTDAVNTLIAGFLTIYAIEEVGFSDAQVRDLLIVAIAGSILGGFAGGRLVDVVGPRPPPARGAAHLGGGLRRRHRRRGHRMAVPGVAPGGAGWVGARRHLGRRPGLHAADLPAASSRRVLRPLRHGGPVRHHPGPAALGSRGHGVRPASRGGPGGPHPAAHHREGDPAEVDDRPRDWAEADLVAEG